MVKVEPDRFLSTSSEGLSATTEIEAPFFINYGSRTLLGSRTWQGKLSLFDLPKSMRANLISIALSSANTIVSPGNFLKKEMFPAENLISSRGTNPDNDP